MELTLKNWSTYDLPLAWSTVYLVVSVIVSCVFLLWSLDEAFYLLADAFGSFRRALRS